MRQRNVSLTSTDDGDYPRTPEPNNDDHTCNDKGNAEGYYQMNEGLKTMSPRFERSNENMIWRSSSCSWNNVLIITIKYHLRKFTHDSFMDILQNTLIRKKH